MPASRAAARMRPPYLVKLHTLDDYGRAAEAWFTSINAPRKAFVRFEGCHHFVVMNGPEMFLEHCWITSSRQFLRR